MTPGELQRLSPEKRAEYLEIEREIAILKGNVPPPAPVHYPAPPVGFSDEADFPQNVNAPLPPAVVQDMHPDIDYDWRGSIKDFDLNTAEARKFLQEKLYQRQLLRKSELSGIPVDKLSQADTPPEYVFDTDDGDLTVRKYGEESARMVDPDFLKQIRQGNIWGAIKDIPADVMDVTGDIYKVAAPMAVGGAAGAAVGGPWGLPVGALAGGLTGYANNLAQQKVRESLGGREASHKSAAIEGALEAASIGTLGVGRASGPIAKGINIEGGFLGKLSEAMPAVKERLTGVSRHAWEALERQADWLRQKQKAGATPDAINKELIDNEATGLMKKMADAKTITNNAYEKAAQRVTNAQRNEGYPLVDVSNALKFLKEEAAKVKDTHKGLDKGLAQGKLSAIKDIEKSVSGTVQTLDPFGMGQAVKTSPRTKLETTAAIQASRALSEMAGNYKINPAELVQKGSEGLKPTTKYERSLAQKTKRLLDNAVDANAPTLAPLRENYHKVATAVSLAKKKLNSYSKFEGAAKKEIGATGYNDAHTQFKKIDKVLGTNLQDTSEKLMVANKFLEPPMGPVSSKGTTSTSITKVATALGMLGGTPGLYQGIDQNSIAKTLLSTAAANALTSPWMWAQGGKLRRAAKPYTDQLPVRAAINAPEFDWFNKELEIQPDYERQPK